MRFFSIASGSKGNCVCVESGGEAVLIDAGVSIKRVREALDGAGISAEAVKGIFLTHEHSDHVRYMRYVYSAVRSPIFANLNTIEAVCGKDCSIGCRFYELPVAKEAELGTLRVTSFRTSHDAAESVGYTVTDGVSKFSVATDLGVMTEEVLIHIRQSDALVLESNYDENMLKNGIYPLALQQRILSEHGHLSNDSCAVTAAALVKGGTRKIVLGHLSENNNTPMVAYTRTVRELEENGIVLQQDVSLMVASREKNSALLEVRE